MGKITINGRPKAGDKFELHLDNGGRETLRMPAPLKEYLTNDNPTENGQDVAVSAPKVAARTFTLPLIIKADDRATYDAAFDVVCAELEKGVLNVKETDRAGVVFRCGFQSCTQYSRFNGRTAKFALKLIEFNPKNRGI